MYTEAPKIIPGWLERERGMVNGCMTGHTLTVTQCEFSPNGQWLLSVSRDRTVIVYGTSQGISTVLYKVDVIYCDADGQWTAVYQSASKGGPHSRIIWSCAWFHDSTHFVTVSREGKVD